MTFPVFLCLWRIIHFCLHLLCSSWVTPHAIPQQVAWFTTVVQPKLRRISGVKWTLLMVWRGWPGQGRLRGVNGGALRKASTWVTGEGPRNSSRDRQFRSWTSPCSPRERLGLYWKVVGTLRLAWWEAFESLGHALGGALWMLSPTGKTAGEWGVWEFFVLASFILYSIRKWAEVLLRLMFLHMKIVCPNDRPQSCGHNRPCPMTSRTMSENEFFLFLHRACQAFVTAVEC